jgi:putative transposase
MKVAVDYYWEHGRSLGRTVKKLGYPSKPALKAWIVRLTPNADSLLTKPRPVVTFTEEQKREAIIELCAKETSAAIVARQLGTTRHDLYNWKYKLLGKECVPEMRKDNDSNSSEDLEVLHEQVRQLNRQIYRQRMELDVLTKAAEFIKKEKGFNLKQLSNKEKTRIVEALRAKYKLKELLALLDLPKNSYYYQRVVLNKRDKHAALRTHIIMLFHENYDCYGYRRIHALLQLEGVQVSEKIIRRMMQEENLVAVEKRKRRYTSYLGEISPAVDNLIDRNFHAKVPETKWLTDLTEFQIPAGKVYVSPLIDCFDGLVVSWSIGTSPNAELVNSMLDTAVSRLGDQVKPVVHSDRGCHYRWPGWIARMDHAKLTRSMSRKGCSPDNAACEGFFGRMKNECFYNRSFKNYSMDQFIQYIDRYIHWYNTKRIKKRLGYLSPVTFRQQLNEAV